MYNDFKASLSLLVLYSFFVLLFLSYLFSKNNKIKEMSESDGNVLAAQFRELQQGIKDFNTKMNFGKKIENMFYLD